MSMTVPDEALARGEDPHGDHTVWRAITTLLGWFLAFAAMAAVVGFLTGVFWWGVVDLPTYTIAQDFRGYTTERGLTEFFGTDAWFSGLGLTVGAALGYVAWRWFKDVGWPVTFVAALGALLAGGICDVTGRWLGPGSFDSRLAAASPGDVIPIDFQLHSPIALVVWAFAGVLPILVASSMGPDAEEEPRPPRKRRHLSAGRRDEPVEAGEVVGHDIAPLPEPTPRRKFFRFGRSDSE
jgi:hypothetical protein